MTLRLSVHFSIFGMVVFVLKSLLGIARQWSRRKNYSFCSENLGVMLEFKYIEGGPLETMVMQNKVHALCQNGGCILNRTTFRTF